MENLKIRCSSLGAIMTEPRSKTESLSETAKTKLIELYVQEKYKRTNNTETRYTNKGLQVEEDSITLLSRQSKIFYKKNEERISNDFISGTPDLFQGQSIYNANLIIDIKSSWDLFTFTKAKTESLNKNYYWQLQGYMYLTGAMSSKLVYCLINTPDTIVNDEKRRLLWKMGLIDDTDQLFIDACAQIDLNHTFDDIPMDKRIHEIEIPRNDEDIERIANKVELCNQWIKNNLTTL